MRDLYLHLGIDQSVSIPIIQDAIKKCTDDRLKSDAETVLLNPTSKAAYDRLNSLMGRLGGLRADLGLNNGEHWVTADTKDYTKVPSPENATYKQQPKTAERSLLSRTVGFVFRNWMLVLVAGVGGYFYLQDQFTQRDSPYRPSPQYRAPIETLRPSFNQPEVDFPASGTINYAKGKSGVAPLKINTRGSTNYYVKLVDPFTDQDVMEVFVSGGSRVEVDAPLGVYEMRYASGATWYGKKHHFGPDTAYSKADTNFSFTRDARGVSGYTVTLYVVANGNLRTKSLSADQF